MNRAAALLAALALTAGPACHAHRPLLSAESKTTPGTIGGILQTESGEAIAGRRVEAIGLTTGERYSAVTNVTGGFSIPVPPGKYRLQVELQEGETVVRDPGTIEIHSSDLDANLEVVIKG